MNGINKELFNNGVFTKEKIKLILKLVVFLKLVALIMLQSILFSTILFWYLEIPTVRVYLFFVDAILVFVLVRYFHKSNALFYWKILGVLAGNLVTFSVMKYFQGGNISSLGNLEHTLLMIYILLIVIGVFRFANGKKNQYEIENPLIFETRRYDLERILYFVLNSPIVGIEANWGEGKTFLIEQLIKEKRISKEYEIIRIDLLTCKLDEIENTILMELENVLKKNSIFSMSSKQLRKMLGGNQFLEQIQLIILGDNIPVSSTFEEIKRDIRKIEKSILVIYDDIERIDDEHIIKKIFAISEKLSGDKIHFIY